MNAIKLSEYPTEMCASRATAATTRGNTEKDKLIAQFGADAMLPYLRYEIAKCERHQVSRWHDRGYAASREEAMAAFKAAWESILSGKV